MLEFDKENHIYLKDGVILRSVTQILKELFPSKYDGIPKEILENKSIYGTELHKFIEIIEKKKPKRPLSYIKRYYNPNIYQIESLKDYLEIKKKYKIEITDSEKMVVYKDIYCGTLDLKGTVGNKKAIIDIKTTYDLDELYVSWQNSLFNKLFSNNLQGPQVFENTLYNTNLSIIKHFYKLQNHLHTNHLNLL